MSHDLPPRPSLEHLRKQAKDLLHELRQGDPAVKLADAQLAIAREYGFASWPKLKARVESLPGAGASARAIGSDPSQRGSDAPSPFAGDWTANVSKSKRHPANPFQRATIQFAVVGHIVTIADVVVDASGREEHGKNTIHADGREHPSEHGNGYVLMASWRGSHVLETVGKKDVEVVGRATYEVSADGQTLTVSAADQLIVLDRK